MKNKILFIPFLLLSLFSCDYLEKEPVGQVIPESTSDFRALITSAYQKFPDYKQLLTARADEVDLDMMALSFDEFKDIVSWNDNNPDWKSRTYPWLSAYNPIFYTNHIINDGLNAVNDGSESIGQVRAEAYMLRAYLHFELVNLYGAPYNKATASSDRGVPLSTQIDIEQEFIPVSVEEVYNQIWSDIHAGEAIMEVESQVPSLRYRFSLQAARMLKARVALYQNNWELALAAAQEVIKTNPTLENYNDPNAVTANHYTSKECILATERVTNLDLNDTDFNISDNLLSAYDKKEDLRYGRFFYEKFGYMHCGKYKTPTDRITFRTSEAYLIASEAAAQLGMEAEARQYLLDLAVNRLTPTGFEAYQAKVQAASGKTLIEEIALERKRELALEGNRWYDLRRTTRPQIDKTLMILEPFDMLMFTLYQDDPRYTLPYPKEAVENNPNLKP